MKSHYEPKPVPMPPVHAPREPHDKPDKKTLLRSLECCGNADDCSGCQLERTTNCKQKLLRMAADMIESGVNFEELPAGISFSLAPYCAGCVEFSSNVESTALYGGDEIVLAGHRITCSKAGICKRLRAMLKGASV